MITPFRLSKIGIKVLSVTSSFASDRLEFNRLHWYYFECTLSVLEELRSNCVFKNGASATLILIINSSTAIVLLL